MSSPPKTGTFTLVSFHAHPDDEALLTAGTLARAAAEGHRVVIVVATNGEAGLSDSGTADLGQVRRDELRAAATAIGAQAVHFLDYPDTGYDPRQPKATRPSSTFATVDPEDPARRLTEILLAEQADVLTSYDPSGGYGHPDHIQVHRVGALAAHAARTPVLLEATLNRDLLLRAVSILHRMRRLVPGPDIPDLRQGFLPADQLTHRVNVKRYLNAKIRALEAHHTQTSGGDTARTLAMLLRLPRPLRRYVLGTEWFREVGRTPAPVPLDDIFASLR